nr:TadE family protein [Kineococcus rhizosphaerae]
MLGSRRPSQDGARRCGPAHLGADAGQGAGRGARGLRRGLRDGLRRALAGAGQDRGEAVVQAAVLFPFLIILTFAIIQAGIWFYARSAALNAAEEGLQAARAENGSSAAAVAASDSFLQRAASGSVLNPSTQVDVSPLTISVTVSGESTSIVDFLPLPRFSQTVTGATERFTTN